MTLTEKEISDHKKAAKQMEWDGLLITITDMVLEIRELSEFFTKEELEDRKVILGIYEKVEYERSLSDCPRWH